MAMDLQSVRQVIERVFARQDMTQACMSRDLGEVIRILGKYGISQGQMASLTGIPQGRLSEYKTGKRVPTLNTLEVFADGLGMPEDARRAFGLAPTGSVDTGNADGVDSSHLIDVLSLAGVAGSLDNRIDRRTIFQLAASMAAAPFLGLDEPTERLVFALLSPTELHEDTVDFLEQRTIGLHRVEPMFQARVVHRAIMTHLRELTALLEGHSRDPLRSRLAKITGETAVLAAWTAWDLGEPAHASRIYRIVNIAAKEANDPVIVACANTYRSYATHGHSSHEDARRLLAEAHQLLPDRGDDATRAWVLGREAEEAAAIGDPIAKDLIEKAVDAFQRSMPQKERPWTRFLDEPRIDALQLATYTRLGDEEQVYELADRLLETVTPSTKRAALINADVGIAAVRLGDVNNGINYGRRSLEAVRASETSFGLWRLEELAKALAQEPRARELRAEIKKTRQTLTSPR
jgi:transcriptional regulator with XRE-family HTH domain